MPSVEPDGTWTRSKFAVHYTYDVTFKPTGKREIMEEMALYTVNDGKIVREEFFYNPNKT